jgi:hypothetical protein
MVMVAVMSFSGLVTLAGLTLEIMAKVATGSPHIGAFRIMMYMGARPEDMFEPGSEPWFIWLLALYPIMPLALALLVYSVLKARWAPTDSSPASRIQGQSVRGANTSSRVESSANGITFCGTVVCLAMVIIISTVTASLFRKVGTRFSQHYTDRQEYVAGSAQTCQLTAGYFLCATCWAVTAGSWVLSNREAQRWGEHSYCHYRPMPMNVLQCC